MSTQSSHCPSTSNAEMEKMPQWGCPMVQLTRDSASGRGHLGTPQESWSQALLWRPVLRQPLPPVCPVQLLCPLNLNQGSSLELPCVPTMGSSIPLAPDTWLLASAEAPQGSRPARSAQVPRGPCWCLGFSSANRGWLFRALGASELASWWPGAVGLGRLPGGEGFSESLGPSEVTPTKRAMHLTFSK